MKSALLALAASATLSGADCERLAKLSLPHTEIKVAEARQPGEFTSPYGGRPLTGLPAFCRVAGTIRPTADSDIRFEVWLPASGWNGKFQGIGNGGYAGTISFAGLADAVRNAYASASTDTGHEDTAATAPSGRSIIPKRSPISATAPSMKRHWPRRPSSRPITAMRRSARISTPVRTADGRP